MTMKEMGFYRGVNLGGWFSQCDYSEERLNHFIREDDFAVIAEWGLDHVRIPMDYNVLEDGKGGFRTEGFRRIEKAIGQAQKQKLKVVLDLHKTAGFSFDSGEKETGFFDNETYQRRFYALWKELARQFYDAENIAFELLNEVTDASYIDAWNRIAGECIQEVRKIAPQALILIGSYHNNSPHALKDLDVPTDDRTVYNFHCYDPLAFTHQGAHWVPVLDIHKRIPFAEAGIGPDFFESIFGEAIQAAAKKNVSLYCGEYGVIEQVTPEDTVQWYQTIHDTFEKYGIARSAWSYRQMNFGLSDTRLDGVRKQLIKCL